MPTLLIIDDKRDNRIAIAALLKTLIPESTIETAASGAEGINKIDKLTPDVVLLDIHMPEMDGFEVLKILKNKTRTRQVPVIMLTALRNDVESCVRALEIGADAFLTKPMDEAELAAQVKTVLRTRRAREMQTMGVPAGGIAHDFNNILFPIMGYVEMMQEDLPTDSHYQDYLKKIMQGTARARDLISQIEGR